MPLVEQARAFLEARHIPPAAAVAAAVIVVILVVAGVYFALQPQKPSFTPFSLTVLSDQEPVSGATVEVYEGSELLDATTTDSDGVAAFASLPATSLQFRISKTGLPAGEITFNLGRTRAGEIDLTAPQASATAGVTAKPTAVPVNKTRQAASAPVAKFSEDNPPKGRLAVILKNAEGRVIDGIVTLFNSDSGAQLGVMDTTRGIATFDDLDSGTKVYLTASAKEAGYVDYPADGRKVDIVIKAGPLTSTVVVLTAASENATSLPLSVVDEAGKAIAGATVWFVSNDQVVIKQAATGADGGVSATLSANFSGYAVAKKDGYLAGQAALVTGQPATIVLANATEANSANLELKVFDETAAVVSGAGVTIRTESGTFLAPAIQSDSQGIASFRELPRGPTLRAVASKGNKIGSKSIAMSNRSVRDNVTLVMHTGTIAVSAADAISGSVVDGASFTAFYRGVKLAECTGNGCLLAVRANSVLTIMASHSDYYSTNFTQTVQTDANITAQVRMVSKASVTNTFAQVVKVFDAAEPAVPVTYLKKGHDYTIQFHFISASAGPNEESGLIVRVGGEDIYIKGIGQVAGFRGSDSDSCDGADEQFDPQKAYQWINLRTKGPADATFSVDFRVGPDAPDNVSMGFSTYVIKGGQWLRNPYDDVLKTNESTRDRAWCFAEVSNAFTFGTRNPDVSCTQEGCVKMTFSQSQQSCGFDETGISCEGFNASSDTQQDGNLLVHYSITPYSTAPAGKTLRLKYDQNLFDFVSMTVPSHGATFFIPTTLTINTTGSPGTVTASAQKALERSDFPFYGKVEGTIVLAPKAPSSGAIVELSFNGPDGTAAQKSRINIKRIDRGLWFNDDLSAQCQPSEPGCDVYCYRPVGNCSDYDIKLNVSFSQGDLAGGKGFAAAKSSSDACADGMTITYALEDKQQPLSGGVLTLGGFGTDLKLLLSDPTLLISPDGVFTRTIDVSQVGAGQVITGTICAKVVKDFGEIKMRMTYAKTSLTHTYDSYVLVQIPPVPDKYFVKYYLNGGVGSDEFKLLDSDQQEAPQVDLFSSPMFPADAVYLVLDYSESTCPDAEPLVGMQNPCFSIATTGLKTRPYDKKLRQKIVLLKYDALAPGCTDFVNENPNELASNTVDVSFAIACSAANKTIRAVVEPDNRVPALALFPAEDAGYLNYGCGVGSQPQTMILLNNRQYGNFGNLQVVYSRSGPQVSDSMKFTEPGTKVFAARTPADYVIRLGTLDITRFINASSVKAAALGLDFNIATLKTGSLFRRRSVDDQAFPFNVFKGTSPAKMAWVGTGGGGISFSGETNCGSRKGLFGYAFPVAAYNPDYVYYISKLIRDTVAIPQAVAATNMFFDSAQDCSGVSSTMCGYGYSGCGDCVIPRYGANSYSHCKASSDTFTTGITYMHAPTCNIFYAYPSDSCKDTSTGCGFKQHLGRITYYETVSLHDTRGLTGDASPKVCVGNHFDDDEDCNGVCSNNRGPDEYASGVYSFNGMTITLLNNRERDCDTPAGCDCDIRYKVGGNRVGPTGAPKCGQSLYESVETSNPDCGASSYLACINQHCGFTEVNGLACYHNMTSCYSIDCPGGYTSNCPSAAQCTRGMFSCP